MGGEDLQGSKQILDQYKTYGISQQGLQHYIALSTSRSGLADDQRPTYLDEALRRREEAL